MKLNQFLIVILVYGFMTCMSYGVENAVDADQQLLKLVNEVLKADLVLKGNFHSSVQEKNTLNDAVTRLSKALEEVQSGQVHPMFLSNTLFQKIDKLSGLEKSQSLTKSKVYRLVFLILKMRALNLQEAKLQESDEYKLIVFNIYNVLIDQLIDFFSIKSEFTENISIILSDLEVALYLVFIMNFMELEFLDLKPINDRITGNKKLNIMSLNEVFAFQLRRTGGIPAEEAENILKLLLDAIEQSLFLENNPIGVHSLNPLVQLVSEIIKISFNKIKTYLDRGDQHAVKEYPMDSFLNINHISLESIEVFSNETLRNTSGYQQSH